jgi:formylglycine-generating enzyme required for sulfatase activity
MNESTTIARLYNLVTLLAKEGEASSEEDWLLSAEAVRDSLWLATKMIVPEPVVELDIPEIESIDLPLSASSLLIESTEIEPGISDLPFTLPFNETTHSEEAVIEEEEDSSIADVILPHNSSQTSTTTEEVKSVPQPAPLDTIPVMAPTAPALRKSLEIARSLRPLKRRVPSRRQVVLDEEETANRIAESRAAGKTGWIPVTVPAMERWLDVAIVVEESRSTFIWQELVDELRRLLECQGAFRDVRTWHLNPIEHPKVSKEEWQLFVWGSDRQQFHAPGYLIEPTARRLILVVSDCVSDVWRSGKMQNLLQKWSKQQPVALVTLLPERLWERTSLADGSTITLVSPFVGCTTEQLTITKVPAWRDLEEIDSNSLKLPIMTLEPAAMQRWAKMLAGVGTKPGRGVLFENWLDSPHPSPLPSVGEGERASCISPEEEEANKKKETEKLMQRFWLTASPLAQQLARLMSAAPVSMPVVYVIQQALLPQSFQVHVAEVFMSGLIRADRDVNPPTYDFVDGVRDSLGRATPISETVDVLVAVSRYFAAKAGLSVSGFAALLVLRENCSPEQQEMVRPFASLTIEVLKRLGGSYAALADRATFSEKTNHETVQGVSVEMTPAITTDMQPLVLPPLPSSHNPHQFSEQIELDVLNTVEWQVAEFEVVTIELKDDEKLESFEFETATLVQKKVGLSRRETNWVIQRQTGKAHQFVEKLDDRVNLEMVKIPAGRFLMGSSKNEADSQSNERPQHPVAVSEFYCGKYPITQAQWRLIAQLPVIQRKLEADPSRFRGNDNLPVENVSWNEAVEFCQRLSKLTGREYRLPSEAQWEYACRSGTTTPFHFGKTISTDVANYDGNYVYGQGSKGIYLEKTTPAGNFKVANAFGLYDMHGNVWEWCLDNWHSYYQGAPIDGSAWLDKNNSDYHVLRGGSWFGNPHYCRSASRNDFSFPYNHNDNIGFRVMCPAASTL